MNNHLFNNVQIYYILLADTKKIGISAFYCTSKHENANILIAFSFYLLLE